MNVFYYQYIKLFLKLHQKFIIYLKKKKTKETQFVETTFCTISVNLQTSSNDTHQMENGYAPYRIYHSYYIYFIYIIVIVGTYMTVRISI